IALGRYWRWIHLLNIPALILGVGHTLWLGSHYFGALEVSGSQVTSALLLAGLTLFVLLVRQRWIWSLLSLERFYAPVLKSK
ncbi:MAG: sulfite exporter TauE/SafE family protein, partial [Leptolyngbyaceae cyanobacterium CAN_BIN12]|nr:sulfite exporter TauE/SafE family protein [Leptolyngbyaceae cyanobacterium CAN_BIN12]